jgi:hypothetical protein
VKSPVIAQSDSPASTRSKTSRTNGSASSSRNRHHYREAGDLMVQLHVERTIAASPERVFDWLADPTNLGRFSFGSQGRLGEGFVGARRGRSWPLEDRALTADVIVRTQFKGTTTPARLPGDRAS